MFSDGSGFYLCGRVMRVVLVARYFEILSTVVLHLNGVPSKDFLNDNSRGRAGSCLCPCLAEE